MSGSYHPSPLYLRASELPDLVVGEHPVERVLFHDDRDYHTDVSDRQGGLSAKGRRVSASIASRTPLCTRSNTNNGGALSAVRMQCNYLGVWPQ